MTDQELLDHINDLTENAANTRQELESGAIPADREHEVSEHADYLEEQVVLAQGGWPYPATPPNDSIAEQQAERAEWYARISATDGYDHVDADAAGS